MNCVRVPLKAGTHEGACSRSTLLQHAPGAKLPRLHQRFLAKKYVAQQNFCSRVLLPHIKLVSYEGASSRGKLNLLHESVSGASSLVCTEICLPSHDVAPVGQSNWLIFFLSTTHCELTFIVPMPQSGCFIIQLPRRVLRVYWLGYLPGTVFRGRVSGASSLVCTGLKTLLKWRLFYYIYSKNFWK